MTGWTPEELERIERAEELQLAPARPDGTFRPAVTIWVVRHDDNVYVRSWRGLTGGWYRAVQDTRAAHVRVGCREGRPDRGRHR